MHKAVSQKFKAAAMELGFKQVPINPDEAANGMTALYVPDGISPAAIIGALAARDIVIAGGLHKDIKTRYIRFGHMGETVVRTERGDVDRLIAGLQSAWAEVTSN